jgi:hypothetical protein
MANEAFESGFSGGIGAAKKKKDAKPAPASTNPTKASPSSFKKGGKVKKTGMAKVHRGEFVLTAKEAKGKNKSSRKKVSSKR